MKFKPLLLVLACTAFPVSQVVAQAPQTPQRAAPAKPAPKPATAADRTATLGGGTGSTSRRPILTRDELRACLKQEESIRTRLAEHEAARGVLDRERESIAVAREGLSAERTKIQALTDQATAFRATMEAHSARVQQWNKDVEAFNAKPPAGAAGDRERARLNTEREALAKAQTDLQAERARLAASSEPVVAAYNTNAKAVEARVVDWNTRNQAWNDAGVQLETERRGWVQECADRRYREEDEAAIKAGK